MILIFNKKFLFYTPSYLFLFYHRSKNTVVLKISQKLKLLKPNCKFYFLNLKNKFFLISPVKNKNKFFKAQLVNLLFFVKQTLMEFENRIYQKLKLVGVGYKVFAITIKNKLKKILLFKLGFSHFIFVKIIPKISVFCFKNSKIFIYGDFLKNVRKFASDIRLLKIPEPYKGKGIAYFNEKIIRKQGKKI